jgi:hypothetical protein
MRQFLLGIGVAAVFAAGCVAGASADGHWSAVPKARAAEGDAPHFAYFCFNASSAEDLHEKANQAGARGWQMVSGAASGDGMVWCFRQPRP